MKTIIDLIKEYILIARKTAEKSKNKVPPSAWSIGKNGNAILIPGFATTWVFLQTIGNFLNKKGYKIHTVSTIEPNYKTIDECALEVTKYIQKNNLQNLIIVAHSKGGLIARAVSENPKVSKNIKTIFNIAVPNKGTIWGYAKVKNLHELSYNSKAIKNLSGSSQKIINIYPKTDQNVIPRNNLKLENVVNIEINIVGHTRILESKETQKVIEKYL